METPEIMDQDSGEMPPPMPTEPVDHKAEPMPLENLPSAEKTPIAPAGLEAVFDVPVRVQAVLGRARMSVAELIQMGPGHVVELDRKVGEPVDIFVNNRLIARGEVVMIDNSLGVTLTEIVRQED